MSVAAIWTDDHEFYRPIQHHVDRSSNIFFLNVTKDKKLKKLKKEIKDEEEWSTISMADTSTPSPQEEFAKIWERTTDDKIDQLTMELRRSSGKRIPLVCSVSALLGAKIGWYQFEFLGMPYEMELVMVFLPFTLMSMHWYSWYRNMNGIWSKLNLTLPPNWKPNEGLIGGTNPYYSYLVSMDDKNNHQLLDEWGKQFNRHRVISATMFCVNISCVMLMAAINPLGDPALSGLEPLTVIGYSMYPLVAYAMNIVILTSPMKNIPMWKDEIVQELQDKKMEEEEHKQ
eukprot:CAMPEP_0202712898 /NCGR_PEP_ID=MMETSP1385-20130828/47557_1 /ASSEMBLY_ACC=CAM_ASM_000861 /TAXON_ID=933848 /ORGANISM="Elphidium margaritaceum" /LENGTH=285 /DNA_ID=CAMNT_0049373089 /DNA_START=29 /DNA_END=887 /DNA_ORIENTATION=-